MPFVPNSSAARINEVSGQFVTPQNSATIPTDALNDGEISAICPNRQPNVAPTKNEGTISPPLKPPPSVTAVKSILAKHAYHTTLPAIASVIVPVPSPKNI